MLANNAGNTNSYSVWDLLAYPFANAACLHFTNLTAYGVRNLTCAGFANVGNLAARNLLGALFAYPAGFADLTCAGLAFPSGYAAVNRFGARLTYSPAYSYRYLLANSLATAFRYADLFGFAGWNPALAANSPVRRLAAYAIPAAWAELAATGARVNAKAAFVPYQFAVAPSRNAFLTGLPMTTTYSYRFGFGVRNPDRPGDVLHLGFLYTTTYHRGDFFGLHFTDRNANGIFDVLHGADRLADGVVHSIVNRLANGTAYCVLFCPAGLLANGTGYWNLYFFTNYPGYIPGLCYFLSVVNCPANCSHHGIASTTSVCDSRSSCSNRVIAGAAATLCKADACRHHSNDGCGSQQTSNQSHVVSPK